MIIEKDPRMREALRLARSGEKEQARQLLVEILRQNRNNFDAWTVMAQVTGDRKEAISSMKQALRLRPNDERAQRYLEYLLSEQADAAPIKVLKTSEWLMVGLGATAVAGLIIASIFLLTRLARAGQSGSASGPQATGQSIDCAALISQALEISDQGCQQLGADQVCYGHNTLQAELVPGANDPFDRPGRIISIRVLKSLSASPLDEQRDDWGVGVFKLEANVPGTLPGQLVTLLVLGNTTVQNVSGDMQAFYFVSGLGGLNCESLALDGILVRMAEGAGAAFKVNGVDMTLRGNSILQAVANDHLTVTALSGSDSVNVSGQEQVFGAGQAVTVPLGGSNGLEAAGPPAAPQPADGTVLDAADCALTGAGCPPTSVPSENLTIPDASTEAGSPDVQTELPPTAFPTPTRSPITPTALATLTETPKPSNTPRLTSTPRPTNTRKPSDKTPAPAYTLAPTSAPPGQSNTPPRQNTPPGQSSTPPGQSNTPKPQPTKKSDPTEPPPTGVP